MNPVHLVHLGIDGGATHSFAVAITPDGRVLASTRAGSLNFFGSGMAETRRSLERLVGTLEQSLPGGTEFGKAVVGCAALFGEATPAERKSLCVGLLSLERTRVISDCMTAYFGAALGQQGVLVISGTGSIVVAQNERGRSAQVGGWGHLLGDEGSAWWIAREALRAAIAASEGRGPRTDLVEAVCRRFKVKELPDIIPILHDPATTKEKFATLAKVLSENSRSDDTVFADILTQAGRALAAQALAVIRSADLKSRPVPVYLVGSVVTKNPLVRESLLASLQEHFPVRVETPQLPPVLGAAAMALREADIALTPEVVANLRGARLPQP